MKKLIVAILIFSIPFQASAWGMLGHRIIGEIADSYLSKKAKKQIAEILGNESVAMSSNWADFIKSDPSYSYLSGWHYINTPTGLSKEGFDAFLAADTVADSYTKIKFLTAELKNKTLEQDKKIFYLRVLIHLVGDIHQPLHAAKMEGQGGNRIRVLWFKDTVNLHQVWDEKLINFQQLSYTEYAAAINHAAKDELAALQTEPLETWLYQSYQLSEKIYGEMKTPFQPLDYKYNFNYLAPLNTQLLKGGVHLAALLNEIFG
jgi:S1/P1 Nuclease